MDEQANATGQGGSRQDFPEPMPQGREREQLRALLLAGAASAPAGVADEHYFQSLRDRITPRQEQDRAMQLTAGTVVQGKVVHDGVSLPEGAQVAVLAQEPDSVVHLSDALRTEL